MSGVKGKALKVGMKDGKFLCLVQLNGKLPKEGDSLTVKWGAQRSLPQNSLYWLYLQWLIDHAGLKDQGHFSAIGLHENLKAHLIPKEGDDNEATTTTLNKIEFSDYFEKVQHFVRDFFEIKDTQFWEENKQRSVA